MVELCLRVLDKKGIHNQWQTSVLVPKKREMLEIAILAQE